MKEVSCAPFDLFFKRALRGGVPLERLTAGTGYSLEHWRNKHERIEWSSMVRFLENASGVWSDTELVEAGAETFNTLKQFGVIARFLFDARGFYEWVFQKQSGAGDQTFSCIDSSIDRMSDGRLKLGMRIRDNQPFSREFFL